MSVQRSSDGKVVYLRPRDARLALWRRLHGGLHEGLARLGWFVRGAVVVVLRLLLGLLRWTVLALLVLFEPLLRVVLVPLAFVTFLLFLVFGLLMDTPRFPTWGMLALSIGSLWAYWLYLSVLLLFMGRGRRGRD